MDRDVLVTGGGHCPSVTWRQVCPWASLFSGITALCLMGGVLLLHLNVGLLAVNALILTAIILPLLT